MQIKSIQRINNYIKLKIKENMEIKINCLRNGINGGGASNGPATLLDGYGTYLYDLYKPSDEDVAAHPELADEPLGIAFPTGNLIEEYTYEPDNPDSLSFLKQLRAIFMPHMYRYLISKDINHEDLELAKQAYINSENNIGDPLLILTNYTRFDIYCAAKRMNNYTEPIIPRTNIDNIFLSSVSCLTTYISNALEKYSNTEIDIDPWFETKNTTGTSIYAMPMFMFRQPSFGSYNNVSHYYNSLFSTEELSKINEADIEYYKKSAVLIYKKDLMDFKNFFKKMMEYGHEINAYSEEVLDSLLSQPQG